MCRFNFDSVFDDTSKAEATSGIISKLHKILGPFMLRRLKTEVIRDIPKKREVIIYCPFTDVQRAFYESAIKRDLMKWASIAKQPGNKGAISSLKNMLMQLRKVLAVIYLVSNLLR